MERIREKDLTQYHFLSGTSLSPDGKHLAFAVSQAVEEDNKYRSCLWLMDTERGTCSRLTRGGTERSCIWLDERTILFSSKRGEAETDQTTYYRMPIDGGEAEYAFTVPYPVSTIEKLGEDSYLIVCKKPCRPVLEEEGKAKEGRDYEIFDEIPFWANGQGIVNKMRSAGMLFHPSTGECTQFTGQYLNLEGARVSKDRSRILFWGTEYTDKMPEQGGLYEYHTGSGITAALLDQGGLEINFAEYWGDAILVEGSKKDRNSSQNPELYLIDPKTKKRKLYAELDGSLGSSPGSDMSYGGGRTIQVIGGHVYASFTSWGKAQIVRLSKDNGQPERIWEFDGVTCFDGTEEKLYCVAFQDYCPQELYILSLSEGPEGKLTKVTNFHQEFLETHTVCRPDYFTFRSKAGHQLEGWVLKPAGFSEKVQYPGVLEMHGGPKAAFGGLYHHEMQCLANQGMFVFYTNPRGSDGRGDAFSDLVGKLGGIDYDDFMEFTDEALKRYPNIDPNRLGISGGSYGGFMCNWMIGHTNRFHAAVSQRSISNYFSKCLTTDIGYYHNLSQVGATPWENAEKMWAHSPLSCAEKAVTPTLFIQADEDYRCWMSEPIQMFTNLRERGVPSKIVLYHGENHELSRSGKPKNRISRLTELCGWFQTYLR